MMSIKGYWNRFWFAPQNATNLGFCRALVMLGAYFYYRSLNLESWGFVHSTFWQVIPLFEHLRWVPLSPMKMWALGFIWKASLLLAGLGLFSRLNSAIAFVFSLYLLGLPNNVGKVDHNDGIVIWSFLIFAVGRSGDAWSVDSLIRTVRARRQSNPPRRGLLPDPEYQWPLRLMQVLMVMIFCIAGTSKLRGAGLAWAFSDNLRNTFLAQQYTSHPMLSWGLWIAAHRYLCMGLGAFTLLMEVGAPAALFNKWLRLFILGSLFFMQIGNELLLGINFRQFMLCYAFWVPWTEVGRFIRQLLNRGKIVQEPKATVLFDGSCGLCTLTMNIVRQLDLLQHIRIMDVTNDWISVSSRFPALNQKQCLQTMHVVRANGQVSTGFFAYRTLTWTIPLGWLVLPLAYLPGIAPLGQFVYEKVARRRFRTGCSIESANPIPHPAS